MEKKLKVKKVSVVLPPKQTQAKLKPTRATIQVNSKSCIPSVLPVDQMTSADFQLDINAHIEVAAQQLKDHVRIRNYEAAIIYNRHLFRGRTVLNIDCGIGILSLFAAKAGAARVFAVDCSNIVDYTRRIVAANGFGDVIEVIKQRIEDVELPVAEVDIIVCDWMGYSLLFQSKCDSVIFARDKWLKKGTGMIFPDIAKLYVAALEDDKHKNERVEWWRNVYGFNMKCLREFALSEPCFQAVHPYQVLSTQSCIKTINMNTVRRKDLKFRSKYMLNIQRSGRIDGVVTYFNVHFSKSHTPMSFSTDPCAPSTHWMQSVFFFDSPVTVAADELIYGGIEMFSPKAECDLNNMEVGIELFSGDPMQLQLEVEMTWNLKPHAVAAQQNVPVKAADAAEAAVVDSTDSAVADISMLSVPSSSSQKKLMETSKKNVATPTQRNVKINNCHKAISPPSITIGKQEYPCVTEKIRKKGKHIKKG